MTYQLSYVMAFLCAIGGVIGYSRTGSVPSFVAGVGVGLVYGYAGHMLQSNKRYGIETAIVASTVLAAAMIPRAIKTEFKKPVPAVMSLLSLLAGAYFVKQLLERA